MTECFTGVALELVPTPSLTPRRAVEAVPLGTFLPAFRGLGSSLAGVFVMTLALQAFALALPLNVQFTIDQGVRQGDWNLVMALALGFGLVGFTSVATQWLRTLLVQYVGNSLSFRMVAGLGHHLLRLPDSWFVARHTGDVMSRFASTEPIRRFLMTGAFAMLVDAAMALGALGILLTLFAFSSYAAIFALRLQSLIESLVNLRMLRLHRERIADIAVEEREQSSPGTDTERPLAGRIEVRGVRFAYGDDAPNVLEGFDLEVSPGEFVAIEGASGCGKSTLIKLLCRLTAPLAGTILVDGVELASL